MDPFAAKLAFSAAAAGAALLGALFPQPDYEAMAPSRPWASLGAVSAWQPASSQMGSAPLDGYSYSGALPSWKGPVDVYGAHPWRLAREREALEREEAALQREVAQAVPPAETAAPVDASPVEGPAVTVHRGSKPAEDVPLEPAETADGDAPVLPMISDQ